MTKLALFGLVAVGLLVFTRQIKADDDDDDRDASPDAVDESDRSGAYAHASASVGPSYQPGGYQPAGYPNPRPRPGPMVPPGSTPGLVSCFSCVDCPNVYYNTTVKLCPRSFDPLKRSSCVTYAEQYKHLKKGWYIRGCASERGSCSDIRLAHNTHSDIVKLQFCNECEGDRCNSATRSLTDFTIAIVSLLVTPLVAKYTLS